MPLHDASHKLLFSHPQMVAGLLELGVEEEWVGEADLSSLKLVPASYVSRDLIKRRGDMVWRLDYRGGPMYLLLEFQSSVDHWMAVRFSTYAGLFLGEVDPAAQAFPKKAASTSVSLAAVQRQRTLNSTSRNTKSV